MEKELPKQWYIECKTEEQKVALASYAGFTWKANFIYQDEKGNKTFSDTLVEEDRGTEITYDDFRRFLAPRTPKIPDNWFITLHGNNRALVNEWKCNQSYNDDLFTNPDYNYVVENGAGKDSEPNKSYQALRTKITTEQFIEHVLNAKTPPPQSYEYLAELFTTLNIQ